MMRETLSWYSVGRAGDVPLMEGKRVFCAGREIALFNLGEKYLAVDNRCPHKAGPLADGIVAGEAVFCPLHNWKISLGTGCALTGGEGKVETYPVRLVDGVIQVELEQAVSA
jgi:nitrite reductase (NADH) small subunit